MGRNNMSADRKRTEERAATVRVSSTPRATVRAVFVFTRTALYAIQRIRELPADSLRELLSLINLSLAYIYGSTTLSNHKLIILNRFVS